MKIIRPLLGYIIGVGGVIGFIPFSNSLVHKEGAFVKSLLYILIWGVLVVGLFLWQLWEGEVSSKDIDNVLKTDALIQKKCPSCRKKLPSRLTKRCPYCTSEIKY